MEKLVRDGIPAIMRRDGIVPKLRVAARGERLFLLLAKLREEAAEFEANPCVEELADLGEVLVALRLEIGVTSRELEETRSRKAEERGSFRDGVVLDLD